ncbi:hypothetical protein BC332_30242 [Capsicum chinense]|nr:hypothetical protein BC332_30242 [Capsicum chinense]
MEHSASKDGTVNWQKSPEHISETLDVIDFLASRFNMMSFDRDNANRNYNSRNVHLKIINVMIVVDGIVHISLVLLMIIASLDVYFVVAQKWLKIRIHGELADTLVTLAVVINVNFYLRRTQMFPL